MLRKYASILRVSSIVVAIVAVIVGLSFALELENAMIFIACLAGSVVSVFSSFALAAFFDTTADNSELLEKLVELQSQGREPTKESPADSPFPRKQAEAPAHSAPADASPVAPQAVMEGYVVCPKCGTMQRASRTICFNCSARFE